MHTGFGINNTNFAGWEQQRQMKFKSTLKLVFDCEIFFPSCSDVHAFNVQCYCRRLRRHCCCRFCEPSHVHFAFITIFFHAICWTFIYISQCSACTETNMKSLINMDQISRSIEKFGSVYSACAMCMCV